MATPVLTEKRLGQMLVGTTITTIYTVPAATSAIVKEIILSNASNGSILAELWCGSGSEITQRIIPGIFIPASGLLSFYGTIPLAPSDVIRAKSSAASVLNCFVTGAEVV